MAISETHYKLLRELKSRGVLPQGGSILEIGQANWYGDMDPREILRDFYGGQPIVADTRRGALESAISEGDSFAVVGILYDLLLTPVAITAIDLDPNAPTAKPLDLNRLEVGSGDRGAFDVAINHGTAEHIFNIANVFQLMHDATKPGGLMIHESPFTGWVDHGFYCLQPTLFYDLAAANGYEMVGVWLEHLASKTTIAIECREHVHHLARADQLPSNAMLFVVMRKGGDELFKVPMQGVYTEAASEAVQQSWRDLR